MAGGSDSVCSGTSIYNEDTSVCSVITLSQPPEINKDIQVLDKCLIVSSLFSGIQTYTPLICDP